MLSGTLESASAMRGEVSCGLVLFGEATQATEPHTLVALNQLAADNCHAVLIGDHLQLAPTVKCQIADEAGLGRSLLERLVPLPGMDVSILTTQYRMHETICSWPSSEYYGGLLIRDESLARRDCVSGFPWPRGARVTLVHVHGK